MVTTTICATTLRRCHLPILSLGPLLTHQTSFGPPLAAIPSIMDRQADSTPVVVSRPYSKAIVAVAMALSLAVSALATAGPAAAQWRGERDGRWWGSMSTAAPWSPPVTTGARDSFWSDDDSCWQVRPIYSISGAWLGNQRVNVCR